METKKGNTPTCGAAANVGDSVYRCSLSPKHEGQHKAPDDSWSRFNGTSNLAVVWDGDANRTCHKCGTVTTDWTKDAGIFWCNGCFGAAHDEFFKFPEGEGTCPCKNGNLGECEFHLYYDAALVVNNHSLLTRCPRYEKGEKK